MTYPQSPRLEVVDREFLTRRRIVRDFQIVFMILFAIATFAARGEAAIPIVIITFVAVVVLLPTVVQRLIRFAFPPHVQSRLPHGPLDVAETPGAPHSYFDLVQIWADPAYRCNHQPNLTLPRLAPPGLGLGPALLLYFLAGLAIAAAVVLPMAAAMSAGLSIVILQICVTVVWQRALRRRAFDVPTGVTIWVTSLIAALIALVVASVVILRAT